MPLTESEVAKIASDARVALGGEELAAMTADLNQILESIQVITEYDLEGVEPTFHPIAGLANVMRDDVVGESMPLEVALENAAQHESGHFKVPPILAEGGC